MHVDDIVQWYSSSGILSGEVESHLLWSGDVLTLVFRGLLTISTNVQWFAVMEMFMAFVALTIVTCAILNNEWGKLGNFIIFMLMFLYGYECYVTIVFTKTSGIVGVLSLFGILSDKIQRKGKIICIVNFVMAISMRLAYRVLKYELLKGFLVVSPQLGPIIYKEVD